MADPREHGKLEKYVKDVMMAHKDDPRVFLWDLYNEPRPRQKSRTWPLLRKTVKWAREVNPSQPLSICVWCGNKEQTDYVLENSDVVTFHCYKWFVIGDSPSDWWGCSPDEEDHLTTKGQVTCSRRERMAGVAMR